MIAMSHRLQPLCPGLAAAALACAVFLALVPAAPAAALEPRPLCKTCRHYIDTSPTAVQAYLDYNGRTKVVEACSLFCMFEQLEDLNGELKFFYVIDYAEWGDPEALPMRADRAWYVFDAEVGDDEKHQAPYTYAFRTEDTAIEYSEVLKGTVMDWETVRERTLELTEEYEPDTHHGYRRNSYH